MEFWFSEFHTPDVKHSIRVNKQLYSKQSDYQRIDIFETPEFGRVLTLDGNVMLTERDDYLGAKLSHACVLRRCHDLIGDGRIHQFCIRSGDRSEFEFAAAHTEMHKFDFTGLAQLTEQLCASKVPVYLTIDLDCLDPSCFPGTGTPEAGGVSFLQLLEAIRTVTKANIVGADLNELAPTLDTTGVSTATACKVLRELLIALDKGWPGFQV